MPVQIINGSGTQYPLVVNPDGSLNVSGVTVISEQVGYDGYQYLIGSAGSNTPVNFVFSSITQAVAIENLGSTPVYFAFNATANTSGPLIIASQSKAFDLQCGSVSILGSGGLTPQVQVFRLS